MQLFRRLFVLAIIILCALTVGAVWLIQDQGAKPEEWTKLPYGEVTFDAVGIPTIKATNWEQLVKAQGFVVASERLWQMDVMRRVASGRLSEWFGTSAIDSDTKHLSEDWQGVALRGVTNLSREEKFYCDAYAEGVNRFIADHKNAWGLEYTMQRQAPDPWRCSDSILVLLYMADNLSGGAQRESQEFRWRQSLTPEWQELIFPRAHPWAKPLFSDRELPQAQLPPADQFLPREKLDFEKSYKEMFEEPLFLGSNSWVWSKKNVGTFLANDPHLQHSVPQTWYAMRLRTANEGWVVGAALAGMPGIILGMNQDLAWGFTNLGDDVDDYLEERVSADGREYLASKNFDREFWRKIVKKTFKIKVKGEDDRTVDAWFTHRGPIAKRKGMGDVFFTRQWLPLRDGSVGLPTLRVNRARNWEEFNGALDRMVIPSQAIVFADRMGNIGMRASGIGIKKDVSTHQPVSALEGEWRGFSDITKQRRLFYKIDEMAEKPKYIANANAQIWTDDYVHRWDSDDRRERIDSVLGSQDDFTREDMEKLQRDTKSRYYRELIQWVAARAKPVTETEQMLMAQWQAWDGNAEADERVFSQALEIDRALMNVLIARIKNKFYGDKKDMPPYAFGRRRAWIVKMLTTENSFAAFGLEDQEVADFLWYTAQEWQKKWTAEGGKTEDNPVMFPNVNRWLTQHPFARSIPLIGKLFKVLSYPQTGQKILVKAETPTSGPTVRLVFDLMRPTNSTWSFPIGQSGHIRSPHYRDQQKLWFSGETLKIIDDSW
jgi:penicillin amidase